MIFVARQVAIIGTACVALGAFAPPTFAQDQAPRNVSVRDRAKAQYGAEGVRAGAFLVFPSAEAIETYNTNVFADDADEVSDMVTQVNLGFGVESNWNTNRLAATAYSASRFYSDFAQQDSTDVGARANGRLDLSRKAYFGFDLGAEKSHEQIAESPTGLSLREPIEYSNLSGGLNYSQAFNQLRFAAFGRVSSYDYTDGVLGTGLVLDQDDRDVDTSELGGRVDYALSPATALFVSARKNWRTHDQDPVLGGLSRDSDGDEVLAGVRFDLTDLLVGEVGIGQFVQRYDAAGVEDTKSATVRSQLQWFPDELVSVTFAASRESGDAGVIGAAGFVRDAASVNIDYEFRRNIIFSVAANGADDDYVGLNRADERRSLTFSTDYIVSRRWSAFASLSRSAQRSSGDIATVGREYDIDRISLGVRWRR